MSVLAVTGGTGFVGKRLIARALAEGHQVRALTRRDQPAREGVTWVAGALDTPAALDALVEGADAVIHVAGVVNAPDRAGFVAGNVEGTRAIVAAAERAGVRRFIQVSSLAAREPDLSIYGWSKAQGDALVTASTLDWTIVRPPAIYGPGDLEMLEMFQLAARGFVPLPPGDRLSILHADDLARLLIALAGSPTGIGAIYEVDDGTPNGWTHAGFAQAIGTAVGRGSGAEAKKSVRTVTLPRAFLSLAARLAVAIQRGNAKLTPDRVAYFCHPDWTAAADRQPPPSLWQPMIPAAEGLAATAAWYRENGLL